MISPAKTKPLSRAERLAREIMDDPKECAALFRIERVTGTNPLAFKPQLKATAQKTLDVEKTSKGHEARLCLLEHRCRTLEQQNIELARELRNIAELVGVKVHL